MRPKKGDVKKRGNLKNHEEHACKESNYQGGEKEKEEENLRW